MSVTSALFVSIALWGSLMGGDWRGAMVRRTHQCLIVFFLCLALRYGFSRVKFVVVCHNNQEC